jgi:hypothetical protein
MISINLSATIISILVMMFPGGEFVRSEPAVSMPNTPPDSASAFAVGELFTSEGCSSCPRADELISELYDSYRSRNQRVYILAFHVDYFDRLGWRDSFGKLEFSDRQRTYASALQLDGIYTPQIIINGSEEMVGSDPKARAAIDASLQKPASVTVTLDGVRRGDDGEIVVHYRLSRLPANSVLNIALVERGLLSQVVKGENAGRTLLHDNVVRGFETLEDPGTDGMCTLDAPSNLQFSKSSIVAYLQDSKSYRILGATGTDLR